MGHMFAHKARPAPTAAKGSTRAPPSRSVTPHRSGVLQRKCACGGTCPDCQGKRTATLRRDAAARGEPATVPPIVHEVLRSPGEPLDAATRAYMEPRFGADFGEVRVHADARAAESASSIDARAFTSNRGIVFGPGEYAPRTESGRRLIAHELTHVVQQGMGVHLKDGVGEASDAYERHADNVARAVVDGHSAAGLVDAYRSPPGAGTVAGSLQRQVTIQRQTLSSEQPTVLSSDQSVSAETTVDTPQESDPLVIEAAVGSKAKNRVDDVAKVQARLLAVVLLSEADFMVESPRTATPASVKSASTPDTAIAGSIAPETAITAAGESLGTTTAAPGPSAETSTASATAPVTAGTMPDSIPESSLTTTIAAIREFQRPLFGKQDVDGNIGPTGPTWRALCATDAAAVAKMKEGWAKKKQQMEEEKTRKLKADAERKKLKAWQQSPEAEQQRKTVADDLLAKYATYIPFTSWYVSLDESGLAGALANLATNNGGVVLKVFDALDADDAVEVASKMLEGKSVKQLVTFDRTVLGRLKRAVTSGMRTGKEAEQIARVDDGLGAQPKGSLTSAAMLEDPATGEFKRPAIDGETLEARIKQIHVFYNQFFVDRATTNDCLKSTKAALQKMGWNVGFGDKNFIPGKIGDVGPSEAQSRELLAALLAEVEAGNPVVIGVNYKAGAPKEQVDQVTDHWLYIVASTVDDTGQPVLVAYENAPVATSKITNGNIVLFRIDELGRIYHGAYSLISENPFSNEPHVVVNFRPARRVAKQ